MLSTKKSHHPNTSQGKKILRWTAAICTSTTLIVPMLFSPLLSANATTLEVNAAQTQVDEALQAVDAAQQQYNAAVENQKNTTQQATDLKNQAQQLGKAADAATRAYIRLLRGSAPSAASLVGHALSSDGNSDLLGRLSMAGKASELLQDNTGIGDHVVAIRANATNLNQQADDTTAAAQAVPVADRANDLSVAENNLASTINHFETLKKQEEEKAQAEATAAAAAAREAASKNASTASTQGSDPASAKAIALEKVKARGWDQSQYTCLVSLWNKESGWNVTAENPSSGAYGIPQSLPGNKMATVGSDWKTNAATQIEWGLNYIATSYSTPCNAWAHSQATNWY